MISISENGAGVDPADGFGMWYQDVTDDDGNVIDKVTTKEYDQATRYQQNLPYQILLVVSQTTLNTSSLI